MQARAAILALCATACGHATEVRGLAWTASSEHSRGTIQVQHWASVADFARLVRSAMKRPPQDECIVWFYPDVGGHDPRAFTVTGDGFRLQAQPFCGNDLSELIMVVGASAPWCVPQQGSQSMIYTARDEEHLGNVLTTITKLAGSGVSVYFGVEDWMKLGRGAHRYWRVCSLEHRP
jgi:hypothetical protein